MYRFVVFLQGDDFEEFETVLDRDGEAAAMDYLKQWETGEGATQAGEPWGSADYVHESGGYVMSYNLRLGYAGLCVRVAG